MDERPSYREWLESQHEARLKGPKHDLTGHPIDPPLPATGDAAYDAKQPRRQAHSQAARDAAGMTRRELDAVRKALDAGEPPTLPEGWTIAND